MNSIPEASPPPIRRRAFHAARVAAMVVGGALVSVATFLVMHRLSPPAATPDARDVTFDVVVTDADSGAAVAIAEAGIDQESGDYDPPPPTWLGATDADGLVRLVWAFNANTAASKDGKARGRVVFHDAVLLSSSSYLLVVRAPGYLEERIDLMTEFPQGIAYEDPSPLTIHVQLTPGTRP